MEPVINYILPTIEDGGRMGFGAPKNLLRVYDGDEPYDLIIPSRPHCSSQDDSKNVQAPQIPSRYALIVPETKQARGKRAVLYYSPGKPKSLLQSDSYSTFYIKDDDSRVRIGGYVYSPISNTEGHITPRSSIAPPESSVAKHEASILANTASSSGSLGRPLNPSRKSYRISTKPEPLSTLTGTICTMIRNLMDDLAFDAKRYSVNVLHSSFRNRDVSVAALPRFGSWNSRILCILFEVPKSILYGRGRAACVRYCTAAAGGSVETSELKVFCSCWEFYENACMHSEELSSVPSLRNCISDFLTFTPSRLQNESFLPQAYAEMLSPGFWCALPTTTRENLQYKYWMAICMRPINGLPPVFIPVMSYKQKLTNKGIGPLRLQCQKCRQSPAKRGSCQHEISVLDALKEGKRSNTFAMDNTEDEESAEDTETDEEDVPSDDGNKFMATRKRSIFSCPSDFDSVRKIISTFAEARQMASAPSVILRDEFSTCQYCLQHVEKEQEFSFAMTYREVILHTLGHGSIDVVVTDHLCPNSGCSKVTYFDGADCGVFAATSRSIYSRDLLDFWLYHTAGLGGTFREAYEISTEIGKSASVSVFRTGLIQRTRRRASSTCFAAFLRTLSIPEGESLATLFKCNACQDSTGRYVGVVMDGTATGILGKLPQFERPSVGIPSAKKSSVSQYILENAKMRKFLERFCDFAKRPSKTGHFRVEMGTGMNYTHWKAGEMLLNSTECERHRRILSELFYSAFIVVPSSCIITSKDNNSTQIGSPEDAEVSPNYTVRLGRGGFQEFRHRLPHREQQTQVTDFLRCFGTSSIPATLLRTADAKKDADALANALLDFSQCSHIASRTKTRKLDFPCVKCARAVYACSKILSSLCPSAGRISTNLATECLERINTSDVSIAREVARTTANVIDASLETCKSFAQKFRKGESEAGKSYNQRHGTAISVDNSELGSQIPQKNGEFFPGRPLCRPRVAFLNANSHPESATESCSKHYKNGASHSPGLFAVQCVCKNPKLIGVSAMDACESLSTALSVLLTRFNVLPKVVYYDNACNLSKSIILRGPWVLQETQLCCDRFHFRSHTCPSVFDPDSFSVLDKHRTSGAEALNSRWATSRSHIRFLDGSNLMPFIMVKSIFINLRALFKERANVWDVEDGDLVSFGNTLLPCQCRRCQPEGEGRESDMNGLSVQLGQVKVKRRKL